MISMKENGVIVRGHGETILLADDDEIVLETFKDILEKLNYIVLIASNGEMAVDMYQSHRDEVDLIILDYALPKWGGRDTLHSIYNINPKARALFVSAFKSSAMDMEVVSYPETVLYKPFTIIELSWAISHLLAD